MASLRNRKINNLFEMDGIILKRKRRVKGFNK